jgi:hypothetical protein
MPANVAPVAVDDAAATSEAVATTIDVVANDTDADAGDVLAVASVTPAAHGLVQITGPRRVTYTPALGYSGPDAFTYTVYDGRGGSDTAVVTVTVAPTAPAGWRVTGGLQPTAGGPTGRTGHTATRLGNGVILLAGGSGTSVETPRNAQLYDPAIGAWTLTGTLGQARSGHTATRLADGKVLVVGGYRLLGAAVPVGVLDSCELYDPATGTWSATGSLRATAGGAGARAGHTATLLESGSVLVVGGIGLSPDTPRSAQLFDPASGTWRHVASLTGPRANHTATRLADGRVLIAGGLQILAGVLPVGFLDSALVYDPTGGTWTESGRMAGTAGGSGGRAGQTA